MSMSQGIPADTEATARALVAAWPQPAGALHPLLDLLLDVNGVSPERLAGFVAELTGLSAAAVLGIAASRRSRTGTDGGVIALCTGLSCRWMGADAARERLTRVPGLRVIEVDCLGACSAAPVMKRGGRLHDGLTPERLDALVAGDH